MREIKFRGKRKGTGKWVYGDLVRDYKRITIIPEEDFSGIEVDPKSVGQFIGRKDENGEEIYEGDIVAHWHNGRITKRTVVRWEPSKCGFNLSVKSKVTIDSNIHENPELLEGMR